MVGTTLGVLGLGNDNLKRLTGFHMVKVIYTNTSNRGPKKDGNMKISSSFTVNWRRLDGTRIDGGGWT